MSTCLCPAYWRREERGGVWLPLCPSGLPLWLVYTKTKFATNCFQTGKMQLSYIGLTPILESEASQKPVWSQSVGILIWCEWAITKNEKYHQTFTFYFCKANKAESTLALKLRGNVSRNPKQMYQWPQNRTCKCVRQDILKKRVETRSHLESPFVQ